MKLFNERVLLREMIESDWVEVHQYASQDQVCQYQPWGPNTVKESQNFVRQAIIDAKIDPRKRFVFAVIYNEKMIGAGEMNIRDVVNRAGEIAYIVNPNYWGQGLATEIAFLLVDFGFKHLQLHRIYATCDPRNIGSNKVLEKIGMIQEGRIRDALLIRSGWRDSLLFSVLEHEWN